jgi:hypothetical protein
MTLEAPSISERSAQQTGAYVVEMPKAGRRVTERSDGNPFDVTNLLRDGYLPYLSTF